MRTIALYPGRFNIFTPGHKASYEELCEVFGKDNVYILTNDIGPTNLFTFEEKRDMMVAFGGIPESQIYKLEKGESPFNPVYFLNQFNLSETVVVFGISKKDLEPDTRFTRKTNKDGSPNYYQPYTLDATPMLQDKEHVYIYGMRTYFFNLYPHMQNASSASHIREYMVEEPDFIDDIVRILSGSKENKLTGKLSEIATTIKARLDIKVYPDYVSRHG